MTVKRKGRKSPSVPQLRSRAAAGEDVDGIRAGVRLGQGNTDVMIGKDDPKDWDDEELLHGRRRDRHGGFAGKDPEVVPKVVHDELIRRMMKSAQHKLNGMNAKALETLQDLMEGTDVDDKVRIKAVEMVLNRTIGKVPEKMEVTATVQPWEALVVEGITYGDEDEPIETTGEEA